jgi:Bax protein
MNRNTLLLIVLGAAIAVAPVLIALSLVSSSRSGKSEITTANTVAAVIDAFKDAGFDPESVLKPGEPELPPVFLASLPDDLKSVKHLDHRKALFVSIVLPHVLRVNDRIGEDRARLIRLQKALSAKRTLRTRDRKWLAQLAKTYRTRPMEMEKLLRRVDVVPPRLTIAQAVQESGWGTSRFARLGNALFGQHAPVGSSAIAAKGDVTVALKAFETIQRSVLGYMRNLNTHRAYRQFRTARAEMRDTGRPIDAVALAASLGRYSEEGTIYVERLRIIIALPEIAAAKGARLAEEQ